MDKLLAKDGIVKSISNKNLLDIEIPNVDLDYQDILVEDLYDFFEKETRILEQLKKEKEIVNSNILNAMGVIWEEQ